MSSMRSTSLAVPAICSTIFDQSGGGAPAVMRASGFGQQLRVAFDKHLSCPCIASVRPVSGAPAQPPIFGQTIQTNDVLLPGFASFVSRADIQHAHDVIEQLFAFGTLKFSHKRLHNAPLANGQAQQLLRWTLMPFPFDLKPFDDPGGDDRFSKRNPAGWSTL